MEEDGLGDLGVGSGCRGAASPLTGEPWVQELRRGHKQGHSRTVSPSIQASPSFHWLPMSHIPPKCRAGRHPGEQQEPRWAEGPWWPHGSTTESYSLPVLEAPGETKVSPGWFLPGAVRGECVRASSFGWLPALFLFLVLQRLHPDIFMFTQRASCVSVSFCPIFPFS